MAEPAAHEKAFRDAVLDPRQPAPAMLRSATGGPPDRRFAVYRNNVTVRLVAALAEIFPATRRIVGAEAFDAAARAFVRAAPPRSPLLFRYGAGFPDFLGGFAPFESLPYLPDVARLERAWLDAWHAADAVALDGAALSTVPAEHLAGLRFVAHPAAGLLPSRYAQVAIFEANRSDADAGRIDAARAQTALVTRPALDVMVTALGVGDAAFIGALMKGGTLAEAAEAGAISQAGFELPGALGLALSSGAFCELRLPAG
jgi:hypothetical protein